MFSNWRKTEGFAQTKTPNLKCNNIKAEFGLLCRPITLQFERTTMARNLLVASVISFQKDVDVVWLRDYCQIPFYQIRPPPKPFESSYCWLACWFLYNKTLLIRPQTGNRLCRLALVVSLGEALPAMDTSTSCINQWGWSDAQQSTHL